MLDCDELNIEGSMGILINRYFTDNTISIFIKITDGLMRNK